MKIHDPEVEAKKAGMREVTKLLPLPESLGLINSIRSAYSRRMQASDAQMSLEISTHVEQARAGMNAISAAHSQISALREKMIPIHRLCKEHPTLVQHHDLLRLLSNASNNLKMSLKDVNSMVSISTEAAKTRASLQLDGQLLRSFERLTALEEKRRFLLSRSKVRIHKEEARKLSDYFQDLTAARAILEQKLWRHVHNFLPLAKDSPKTLVRALIVIEMQELLDQQEQAEEQGGGGEEEEEQKAPGLQAMLPVAAAGEQTTKHVFLTGGRKYKDRCYEEIGKSVKTRFDNLLSNLVMEEDLKAALEEATAITAELVDIHYHVAPCFPPRYAIFRVLVQLFTERLVHMLRKIGVGAENLTNLDILRVTGWVRQYEEQLLKLGVDDSVARVCAESGSMDSLINTYVNRMQSQTQKWCANILEADRRTTPKKRKDGKLWTPAPVDLFHILSEQIELVREKSMDAMLFRVTIAVLEIMAGFQSSQRERLDGLDLQALCALVNNNVLCYDLSLELTNHVMELLTPAYAEQVKFQDTCKGFRDIAQEAVQQQVRLIFEEAGMKKLRTQLYHREWYEGLVTEGLVATLAEHFQHVKVHMEEQSFNFFAEACLQETIVLLVEHILMRKSYINEETLDRVKKDEELLSAFFRETLPSSSVEKRVQPLTDLRELLSADGVDDWILAYTSLLQDCPDCTPRVVEKLLGLREDISRKDAREVMEDCKDVYAWSIARAEIAKQPAQIFSRLACLASPAPLV